MIRFVLGVIVGIVLFFFFFYFDGGTTVRKIGEGLSETGEKMESLVELIKKEKGDWKKGVKKTFSWEDKEIPKKTNR